MCFREYVKNIRSSYTHRAYETVKEITLLLLIVFMVRTFLFGLYQVPTGSMETTMLVGERFFGEKLSYFFRKPCIGEVVALNMPTYPYSTNRIMRLFQEYVWGPENWTKRVIGVPGDHIRGVIEQGKPVVYRNGEKLDEPYINQYPLVYMLPENEDVIREHILDEIRQVVPLSEYKEKAIDCMVNYMMKDYAIPVTCDPIYPIESQFFYRLKEAALLKDAQGNVIYEGPHTPLEHHGIENTIKNEKQIFNGTDEFDVLLGAYDYWLMGDNRLGSTDSRFFGPVAGRLIHGRIIFRIWSIDSHASWWVLDLIRNPVDFWSRIRWNRFFQVIT